MFHVEFAPNRGVSQRAASHPMHDLEKDVEIRLFARKKGRVVPTLEANAFYREVELSFFGLRNIAEHFNC